MRLIDADALKEEFAKHEDRKGYLIGDWEDIIDNAPTVEPTFGLFKEMLCADCVERPKGKWIKHIDNLYSEDSTEECPFCHEEQRLVGNDDNFCPNCGADMRKEAENVSE